MAYVIVDQENTYSSGTHKFTLGATPVDDDDPVLDEIRQAGLPWITVQEDRQIDETLVPEPPEPEPEPGIWETFTGRDGKHYFMSPEGQSAAFDTEEEATERRDEAQGEHPKQEVPLAEELQTSGAQPVHTAEGGGAMTSKELGGEVECRHPGCDRKFRNKGSETNHSRAKHPELFEQKAEED